MESLIQLPDRRVGGTPALSTTSLAVIYAVLVEDGLNETELGKLLMSATFATNLATAIALSAIFIEPNLWFPAFLAGSLALALGLSPSTAPSSSRSGSSPSPS